MDNNIPWRKVSQHSFRKHTKTSKHRVKNVEELYDRAEELNKRLPINSTEKLLDIFYQGDVKYNSTK